jgi:hypothetical protein
MDEGLSCKSWRTALRPAGLGPQRAVAEAFEQSEPAVSTTMNTPPMTDP